VRQHAVNDQQVKMKVIGSEQHIASIACVLHCIACLTQSIGNVVGGFEVVFYQQNLQLNSMRGGCGRRVDYAVRP
jgi:hypothetical protein